MVRSNSAIRDMLDAFWRVALQMRRRTSGDAYATTIGRLDHCEFFRRAYMQLWWGWDRRAVEKAVAEDFVHDARGEAEQSKA